MGMLGTFFGQNPFGALANTAGGLESTASNNANTLFGQSQGLGGELSNYYNQQLQNPQGLGATTLSQMMTQAGQGASGASGTARQGAFDMAARTGNTAALPAAISSANKQGMSNMSNTQNNLAMQNTMQKLNQQQQGAAGLSSLFGQDLSGSMKFGENANSALNTQLSADEQKQAAEQKGLSNMMSLAGGVMGGLPMGAGSVGDIGSNILGGL
jgi:hypothetical protein